jgi:hypothetical protein
VWVSGRRRLVSMSEEVRKVTPKQFLGFAELTCKNIRRREERERVQRMSEVEFRDWVLKRRVEADG